MAGAPLNNTNSRRGREWRDALRKAHNPSIDFGV